MPDNYAVMRWWDCGLRLAREAGYPTDADRKRVVRALAAHSIDHRPEFLQLLMALAYTESRMRMDRVSGAGAVGILQVTRSAAIHSEQTGCANKGTHNKLTQFQSNVNAGSCYLAEALREAGNWPAALAQYNGGYRALTALRNNDTLPQETAQYISRVLYVAAVCAE